MASSSVPSSALEIPHVLNDRLRNIAPGLLHPTEYRISGRSVLLTSRSTRTGPLSSTRGSVYGCCPWTAYSGTCLWARRQTLWIVFCLFIASHTNGIILFILTKDIFIFTYHNSEYQWIGLTSLLTWLLNIFCVIWKSTHIILSVILKSPKDILISVEAQFQFSLKLFY